MGKKSNIKGGNKHKKYAKENGIRLSKKVLE